MANKKE